MKLKDFLTKLNDLVTSDKANEEKDAVEIIHSAAPAEVFQVIFDRGHSTGLTKGKTSTTEIEGKLAAEKKRADDAEVQLKDLKDKNPDAAKLQEKYQNDLQKKDVEHKLELEKKDQQIETERRATARSELIREFEAVGVDPEYAPVLADKDEVKNRIKFNDKGEREVLQKGKELAITPSADKSALKMLAEELYPTVPTRFQISKAKGGGGIQTEDGKGPPKTGVSKVHEDIRNKEKERQKTAGPATSTAADRLSGRRSEVTT